MGKKWLKNLKNKPFPYIAILLVAVMLFEQLFASPIILQAQFAPLRVSEEKLVLVLAEQDLMRTNRVERVVKRYSQDIQKNLDKTTVSILEIESSESPADVASLLKQIYFGNVRDYENRNLEGIVVVGDVPLPVVDRAGYRFVSVYPYTDFEDPYFNYDQSTGYFRPGQLNDFEPELWHGVIQFENEDQYTTYFDKNHAYYEGDDDLTNFDQKIFYAEPIHEAQGLNSSLVRNYQNFLAYMEELAYNRISKELASLLSGGLREEVENLDESLGGLSRGTLTSGFDIDASAPDIYMKNQIEKSFSRLTAIFARAVADQQSAIIGTGRYTSDDYVTPIKAAALKDEFMMNYFMLVNQMIEDKIDELVEEVQAPIQIPNGARFAGNVQVFNPPSLSGSGDSLRVESGPIFSSSSLEEQYFVNNGIDKDFADRVGLFGSSDRLEDAFLGAADEEVEFISSLQQIVGGINTSRITDAEQCRLHIGGRIKTNLSKTVEVKRGQSDGVCYAPWEGRDERSTWSEKPSWQCSSFYGESLRDEYRPEFVDNQNQSLLTHEACFNFRSYDEYLGLLENRSPELASRNPNPSNYRIDGDGFSITFKRLFDAVEEFTGDSSEWNAWGSYFMGNATGQIHKSIRPLGGNSFDILINDKRVSIDEVRRAGIRSWETFVSTYLEDGESLSRLQLSRSLSTSDVVDSINFTFSPIAQRDAISSVVHHKNPDPETLTKIMENPSATDVPVDDVRHVTFAGPNGELQELVYPNIFDATSLSDFRRQIVEVERQLTSLGSDDYANELGQLINATEDNFADGLSSLNRASVETVNELIEWRNLTINQKYSGVIKSLLNQEEGTNTTLPTSFEIAVINSKAGSEGFEYELLTEEAFGVSRGSVSRVTTEFEQSHEEQEDERERSNSSSSNFGDDDRIPFPQWFGYLKDEWLPSVTDITGERTRAQRPNLLSYEESIGDFDSEISNLSIKVGASHQTVEGDPTREVEIVALNDQGQKVIGKSEFATLSISGVEFAEGTDEDPDQAGVQVFMVTGASKVSIVPSQKGRADISASLGDIEITESITFHEQLNLSLISSANETRVNGDEINIRVKLLNENGTSLEFNQPQISVDNPSLVQIDNTTEENQASEFVYKLTPNTKSGRVNVSATLTGASPASREFIVKPGIPKKLFFAEPQTKVDSQNLEIQTVEVSILDEFNNLVRNNFDNVNVATDDPSKVIIVENNISLESGKGLIKYQVADIDAFGNAYLRVQKSGLESAFHKLILGDSLKYDELKSFKNTALYYDLKSTKAEYKNLAPDLILNGKTQAVSTFTAGLEDAAPLFYVHRTGAIEVIENSILNIVTNLGSTQISTDIFDNQDRKFATIKINPSTLEFKGIPTGDITSEAGIFIAPSSEFASVDGSALFSKGDTVLHIGANGIPVIDAEGILVRQKDSQGFYTLEVIDQSGPIAEIIYNFESSGQVRVTPINHPEITYKEGVTLPSSSMPEGLIFFNPNIKIDSNQKPQRSSLRDDQFLESELIGLREGDKSVLLFAAGQSVGQANQPYLSEIGMVIGDPVISLPKPRNRSLTTGFGYDIGHYVGRTSDDVQSIVNTDEAVIFGDRNGNISILDKKSKNFQKNILNVPAGIKEMHEVNLDGRKKDIMILTDQECINNDSCIYILRNNELERVEINSDSKAQTLLPGDFNGDGDDDLAILTTAKSIELHVNKNGKIEPSGSSVATTAAKIDQTKNLASDVWISSDTGSFTLRRQTQASSRSSSSTNGGRVVSTTETSPVYETFTFKTLVGSDHDNPATPGEIERSPFISSTMYRRDKNGGLLRDKDILEYTLTLNAAEGSYSNRVISIPFSSNLRFLEDTLTEGYEVIEVDSQQRKFLISGVNLNAGSTVQIKFDVEYQASSQEKSAIVQIVTDEEGYPADSLPDFKLQIPGADFTIYYYSVFDRSTNRLSYERFEKTLPQADLSSHLPETPDLTDEASADDFARDLEAQVASTDSDGDGIADAIDSMNSGLNDLATGVEDAISSFMCNGGGCIATPINRAFLVPNNGVPGTPIFGWGCTGIPPVLPGTAANACGGGRFYISPTLTGELAVALCVGTYGTPACWTTSIADLGAACDAINAGIQDLMSSAVNAVTSPLGNAVVVTDVSASGDDPIQTSSNIQVPGFPAVITDWVTAQYEEIQRKLLRLPELTIIYPSPASIAAGFKTDPEADELDTEGVRFDRLSDVLADIHAMPLFNVELETQIVKYPSINPEEFSKYRTQIEEIYQQNRAVVKRAIDSWGCYNSEFVSESEFDRRLRDGDLELSASASNECISLELNALRLFAAFDANIDALKAYRDLPRNIFEAENFLADYASQLLGYVDTILDSTAGYISRNTQRLEQWQQTFIDIQNLIESISAILDVSLAYMESCDDCRSSRTNGGFQLVLNFFLQIPTPPVIPFPQVLPDITIDVSQIDAQVDIVLPKFEFVADTIVLPDLKNFIISLPDAPPIDFTANPGKYGLGLFATIPSPPDIGALIVDLPELPELNLPKLPELPKAPSIDGPVLDFLAEIEVLLDTLSTILRIYCLLQKGLIPTSELQLAAQIQEMTARPLTPVLPIDIGLGFQAPNVEIDYVQELKLILETNLQFNFGLLNDAAEGITDKFNEFETNLNKGVEQKLQQGFDAAQPLPEEFVVPGTEEINDLDLDFEALREDLDQKFASLIDQSEQISATTADEITLVATQEKVGELPRIASLDLDRNFKIPSTLQTEVRKIAAFQKGNTEEIDRLNAELRLIASNEIPPEGNDIRTETFQLAQARTIGFNNSAEFNPEGGIYVYNAELERTERVVNYNAEPTSNIKVSMNDTDLDGDEDIVYARGNEIYFKENLDSEARPTRNTARIETKKFDDLREHVGDLATLSQATVKTTARHKTITLTLPESLKDKNIIIDVYEANLENSAKDSRFIVESLAPISAFEQVNSAELQNGQTITKDGFDNFNYKGGFTQSLTLNLENKTYQIAVMVANPITNKLDVVVPLISTTPNICSDESPPQISVAPDNKIKVPILKPVDIDLAASTDSETEIAQFYIDTDPETDSDGDGDSTNDKILASPEDRLLSRFRLRGSNSERNYTVTAWAVDLAGNKASRRIDIEVVTPKVVIDDLEADGISGHIDPPTDNVDLTIVRERDGVLTEIGDVTTDEDGEFNFDDLETEGNLIITDASGNQLFEINEETGSIIAKHSTANIEVVPARVGLNPTTILLKKNDEVITRIVRVPDSNNDVQIVDSKPDNNSLNTTTEVYIIDSNPSDTFEVTSISGGAAGYAGGAEIVQAGSRKLIVDVDGSLIRIGANLNLELETIRSINNPQWFEVRSGSALIAEVFVGTGQEEITFEDPAVVPREGSSEEPGDATAEEPASVPSLSSPFADVSITDEDAEIIEYLKETGVVDGVVRDGVTYFEPDREITRAEYAKIILNTLCIEPRPEAYLPPPTFADIPYNAASTPWYYPYTKETQLQNFFTGYLGEVDPATGLPPFKPQNSITRAEAAKVILEALNTQNILSLSDVPVLEPWYLPYLQISTNLTPYLVNAEEIRQNFLLTPEEAEVPLRNITRREFAIMAYRALNVQNCLEVDADNDGLPYYFENQHDLDPNTDDADADNDGDGVSNADEFAAGTDPSAPETPRNVVQTEAGIYMERIICSACPCQYNVEHEADIRPGDTVFVILRGSSGGTIYQRSEPVTFRP